MSLSDNDTDQFEQFDIDQLETFDSEKITRADETKPDFNRFKLLFEKSALEPDPPVVFEALIEAEKETDTIEFQPLIEDNDQDHDEPETEDSADESSPPDVVEEPQDSRETPEEKGYKEGFENGYAEGLTQGQEQGFKEGLEKGEKQGFETGEKQGFEKGEEQGRQEGLKAGTEAADKETREKAVEILGSLEQTLKTADDMLELLVEKYEDRLIHLVCRIAEKAVFANIEADDEIVKPMILDALKTLVAPETIELSVNEADYEYIEMVKDDFFQQINTLQQVSVISDPGIEKGGCKIKTRTASIETDPSQRLEAIFEAIRDQAGK